MSKLTDFLPYVLPYVLGCSEPMAVQHVRMACIDFCVSTGLWKVMTEGVNVNAGVNQYFVENPSDSNVAQVERVWFRGTPIPVTNDHITPQDAYSAANPLSIVGTPSRAIYDKATNNIILTPTPDEAASKALALYLVLKPSRTSNNVPDFLFKDYAAEIASGAIASLMRMPDQPYTNADSQTHARFFFEAKHKAKIQSNKRFASSRMAVAMNPFA